VPHWWAPRATLGRSVNEIVKLKTTTRRRRRRSKQIGTTAVWTGNIYISVRGRDISPAIPSPSQIWHPLSFLPKRHWWLNLNWSIQNLRLMTHYTPGCLELYVHPVYRPTQYSWLRAYTLCCIYIWRKTETSNSDLRSICKVPFIINKHVMNRQYFHLNFKTI
jgi:hypothetical protein